MEFHTSVMMSMGRLVFRARAPDASSWYHLKAESAFHEVPVASTTISSAREGFHGGRPGGADEDELVVAGGIGGKEPPG